MMNSGLFPDGSSNTSIAEMNVPKATLRQLHTPVFYANLLGAGHGGTYWDRNGGLCRDKAWSVQKKRID